MDGGELRLSGHRHPVVAIVACGGWICSGSLDGLIRVWSRASAGHQRSLYAYSDDDEVDEHGAYRLDGVYALSAWELESRLISGHASGKLRVWTLWSVATGTCVQVVETSSFEFKYLNWRASILHI